ncbi:MAG: hypothetical protein RRY79_05535 [Clostridia bacterium]
MNKNSIIVSCVVWIAFVIIATVATLSPHGSYAGIDPNATPTPPPFTTPVPGTDEESTIVIKKGADRFSVQLGEMPTLAPIKVRITVDGVETFVRGVELKKLLLFSALSVKNTGTLTVLSHDGTEFKYSMDSINKPSNVYVCYAYEDGTPFKDIKDGGIGAYLVVDFGLPGDQWCIGATEIILP